MKGLENKPILKITELKKYFGNVRAVDGVTFYVRRGEILGIVGPNGAGKTTLLNLISGIIKPDSGKVEIYSDRGDYVNITGWSPIKIKDLKIARTFQMPNIFDDLSVVDNIRLALYTVRKKYFNISELYAENSEINKLTGEILEIFDLNGKDKVKAKDLSHGDRKILDIALAYALNPKILLMDEPTSGLSAVEKNNISKLIKKLRDKMNITIIFVEHDLDVVYTTADRIIVMHEGKIIAEGSSEDIRSNPIVKTIYLGEHSETES